MTFCCSGCSRPEKTPPRQEIRMADAIDQAALVQLVRSISRGKVTAYEILATTLGALRDQMAELLHAACRETVTLLLRGAPILPCWRIIDERQTGHCRRRRTLWPLRIPCTALSFNHYLTRVSLSHHRPMKSYLSTFIVSVSSPLTVRGIASWGCSSHDANRPRG